MNGRYIIDRKLLDSDLWLSEPFTRGQAWVDLIGLARWKDGYALIRGITMPVKRGQCAWSEVGLAKRWSWSKGKVKRFLKWLKVEQQIEQQTSNVTSLITIINYEQYQNLDQQNDPQVIQQTDSRRTANGTRKKKGIKGKKGNNTPPTPPEPKKQNGKYPPPELEDVISYFQSNGYSKEAAKKAFNYYEANKDSRLGNWHDARGNVVKAWKQKMISVWFKPENRDRDDNLDEWVMQ